MQFPGCIILLRTGHAILGRLQLLITKSRFFQPGGQNLYLGESFDSLTTTILPFLVNENAILNMVAF
jgi:hypothetical protein